MDTNDGFAPTNRRALGHFIGVVSASYAELVSVFGEPNSATDEYKVSTSWCIADASTGNVFELYDYKSTVLYSDDLPTVEAFRELPSYDWHIGGRDGACDEDAFAEFLTLKLGRLIVPGK